MATAPVDFIFMFARDWWLQLLYPDLTDAVGSWLEWLDSMPDDAQITPPDDLVRACIHALASWPYMYLRSQP